MNATTSKRGATIRAANTSATYRTQSAITIAVDTAYVVSLGGGSISNGIYMVDNRVTNGSTGEGSLELFSKVNLSDLIGYQVVPINPNSGDTVIITGFNISAGSVFGSSGYPMQSTSPIIGAPTGSYWVAQAVNGNSTVSTYQIQICVTTGGLRSTSYFVNWDPFITTN